MISAAVFSGSMSNVLKKQNKVYIKLLHYADK